jgi:Holliday junction resolvasome RuvABC endonuclease subunit
VSIGIDPGSSSGGISIILEQDQDIDVMNYSIKNLTEKDIVDILKMFKSSDVKVVLEKVHSMPGQGVSSSFTFGENFGFIKGIITALGVKYTLITPQSWMKYYGMKKDKDEAKSDWKKRLRQRAEMLYPDVKITADTADSLLIANYCRYAQF